MTRKTNILGIAAAAMAAAMLAAPSVEAYPDAKVETQLRPDFGLLLKPPIKRRKPHKPRHHHGYRDGKGHGYGYDYGPDYRPWTGPLRQVAFVDCGTARGPNEINHALDSLAPGGTLIIRPGGADRACLDSVRINKPVTIQADGGRPWRGRRLGEYRGDWKPIPATLRARAGQVCIDIAPIPTGEVILRNLVIESTEGGEQPCIYSEGANVRLESSVIRYQGQGSAIYVDGGSFSAGEDSVVDAQTEDRAIFVEDATLTLRDFTISGSAAVALDITPTGNGKSVIEDVAIWSSHPAAEVFGTPSVGIAVSASRNLGKLEIVDTYICGFGIGLWQTGANTTTYRGGQICRAGKGVVAAGGELHLENLAIGANIFGVQVGAARPVHMEHVQIYGVKYQDVYVEPGGIPPVSDDTYFYSYANTYCRAVEVDSRHGDWKRYQKHKRRGGRLFYMPGWHNNGGYCQDPGRLDPRYLDYERDIGYDNADGYYALEPWPRDMYDSHYREWGPNGQPLDPGYANNPGYYNGPSYGDARNPRY